MLQIHGDGRVRLERTREGRNEDLVGDVGGYGEWMRGRVRRRTWEVESGLGAGVGMKADWDGVMFDACVGWLGAVGGFVWMDAGAGWGGLGRGVGVELGAWDCAGQEGLVGEMKEKVGKVRVRKYVKCGFIFEVIELLQHE